MDKDVVYWIIIGCLAVLIIKQLCEELYAIRKSDTKQEVNNQWCSIIDTILIYSTFIALYATGTLGIIYNHISNYISWGLEWPHFIWAEAGFLLIVILIFIVASLPAILLRIVTCKYNMNKVIEEICSVFSLIIWIPIAMGYILLIEVGPVWSLIPFVLVLFSIGAHHNLRHALTWEKILWFILQSVGIVGMGFIAYGLMQCGALSESMGLNNISYAANLVLIVVIFTIPVDFIVAILDRVSPTALIFPSDTKQCKEPHQADASEESVDSQDSHSDKSERNEEKSHELKE